MRDVIAELSNYRRYRSGSESSICSEQTKRRSWKEIIQDLDDSEEIASNKEFPDRSVARTILAPANIQTRSSTLSTCSSVHRFPPEAIRYYSRIGLVAISGV